MGKESREIDVAEYDSLYGTDKYITTWDRLFTEPRDVYVMDPAEEWMVQTEYFGEDLGEDYPRGV